MECLPVVGCFLRPDSFPATVALFRLLYLLTNVDDGGERGRWGKRGREGGGFAFTEMFGHVFAPDAAAASASGGGK